VSVATTLKRCKGRQFAIHAQALPGNPYDGHTLAKVIPAIKKLIGSESSGSTSMAAIAATTRPHLSVQGHTSKQKRRLTPQIKREMRRRSAVQPVIGHLKAGHRMDRNYLAGRHGDANNAVLAAVGYNFRLLIRWLTFLLRLILAAWFGLRKDVFTPADCPAT
jgi:IS5 family transposase